MLHGRGDGLVAKVGTSKTVGLYKGCTISQQAAVHLGRMPRARMKKKKPTIQWVHGFLSGGVKQLGCEVDNSTTSSAKV